MSDVATVEEAERLSKRRSRMLPVLAVVYLAQQASFFAGDGATAARGPDHVKIGAWLVLSLLLLLAIATRGFWFRRAEVRALIDDEVTQGNRGEAMKAGFIAAMLGGIGLYLFDQLEAVTVREAIHVILSLGLGAALVRFGQLERRGHG